MLRKPTHIHRITNPVAMCAVVWINFSPRSGLEETY